jgi:hypothetical protein
MRCGMSSDRPCISLARSLARSLTLLPDRPRISLCLSLPCPLHHLPPSFPPRSLYLSLSLQGALSDLKRFSTRNVREFSRSLVMPVPPPSSSL